MLFETCRVCVCQKTMKILIIRNHRFGDILQLTPMLAGFKEKYPDSRITFLTGDDYRALLGDNPHIDHVVPFPEKWIRHFLGPGDAGYPRVFNRLRDLFARLGQERFDLVVNRQYEEGGHIAHILKADRVVGGRYHPERGHYFDDEPSWRLFNSVRTDRRGNLINLADWACFIAEVQPGISPLMFPVPPAKELKAEALLQGRGGRDARHRVAIQMGAAKPFRRWGTENYTSVIRYLLRTHRSVVLVGTAAEAALGESVTAQMESGAGRIVNLMGKTTLEELGAVLARCDTVITGDTGTMHMAAAVGTPVLSLFYGPAYPWETGPYGNGHFILFSDHPCAPCSDPEACPNGLSCRQAITPEIVIEAYETMISVREGGRGEVTWGRDGVKLLVTRLTPGKGQALQPLPDVLVVGGGFEGSEGRTKKNEGSAAGRIGVHLDVNSVLASYYSGDRETFLMGISEYFENLMILMKQIESGSSRIHETGTDDLSAVKKAMLAAADLIGSQDLVQLADLLQYRLSGAVASLVKRAEYLPRA